MLTADGTAQPERWLGRQTVVTRFADPLRVAPIRIRAGALTDNEPLRDLLASPDHALIVHGVFVQAGALVNGVSITREDADLLESLAYLYVELTAHSLILAKGVAARSFIDNVDRLYFYNWAEHFSLGDDTALIHEMLHRAKAHRQFPQAFRARLMARGVELYGSDVAAATCACAQYVEDDVGDRLQATMEMRARGRRVRVSYPTQARSSSTVD